jgi:hypothetical protein
VGEVFAQSYHWSFMPIEYATDPVFRSPAVLQPLYEQLSRQAILTVKAEHVATFLGHKITPQLAQEIGSQSRGMRQASFRQILDQDLRQTRTGLAHRDDQPTTSSLSSTTAW